MQISKKRFSVILATTILLTISISYLVFAATPITTFYVSEGIYPNAAGFTIWKESSTYYSKNENGMIQFSGTSATYVINSSIAGLPSVTVTLPNAAASQISAPHGKIYIKAGLYIIIEPIIIPLGSRLTIEGEGTTQQMKGNGVNGGTQIRNNAATSALICSSTSGAVTSTGTVLVMKNIEFIQNVNLANNETKCVDLNGMAQGILENVQVIKGYGDVAHRTGIGIECVNNIGVDHAGGYTYWNQIQVYGFTVGLNVSIDHWKCVQLGIANCSRGLNLYNNLATRIEDLHMFECKQILAIYGGFTEYGNIVINGLYLEGCGGGLNNYEWYIDGSFHGYCRIYNTNVNTVDASGTLWRCNDEETLWFEDMMVTGGAPAFPTVSTPGTVNGTIYVNENMQTIQVWLYWVGGINVSVNAHLVSTEAIGSANFVLRPGDYTQVWTTATYTWTWWELSADRGRQDDV